MAQHLSLDGPEMRPSGGEGRGGPSSAAGTEGACCGLGGLLAFAAFFRSPLRDGRNQGAEGGLPGAGARCRLLSVLLNPDC